VEAAGDLLVLFFMRFNGTVLPLEEHRVKSRCARQTAERAAKTFNITDDSNKEMIEEFPHRV